MALTVAFVTAPAIAWATGGKYYIARKPKRSWQNLETITPQLAGQPRGNTVAERIAGGQRNDRLACITSSTDPAGHLAEQAVHVFQSGSVREVRAYQFEGAAGTNHDISRSQTLTGGIGKTGPAVVENAEQGGGRFHHFLSIQARGLCSKPSLG